MIVLIGFFWIKSWIGRVLGEMAKLDFEMLTLFSLFYLCNHCERCNHWNNVCIDAINKGFFEGLTVDSDEVLVSYLQFADDTVFFLEQHVDFFC